MPVYSAKTALLSGAIDYAGTFAPASLPLEEALKKAALFRRSAKHPWLFRRLSLNMEDFKKITPKVLFDLGAEGTPWSFTALMPPFKDSGEKANLELTRSVEWELREIRRWNERWAQGSLPLEIIGYELKLPTEITHKQSSAEVLEFLSPSLERFASLSSPLLTPYFEVSFEANWKEGMQSTAGALSEWVKEKGEMGMIPGIKLRTGGALIPTPDQLAEGIFAITHHHLKFKATQGLHHPYTSGKDFGFINLFSALAFSQATSETEFTLKDCAACLVAPKTDFTLTKDKLSFREFSLTTEEIEGARRVHCATFGSCSIDEPDEFLYEEHP